MKKFFGIFMAAIVATLMVATPAQAREPRTCIATASSEKDIWRTYLGQEVETTYGNTICLTENPDGGFVLEFTVNPEDLDEVEGVRCTGLTAYYELDGMNNAVWDEIMRY